MTPGRSDDTDVADDAGAAPERVKTGEKQWKSDHFTNQNMDLSNKNEDLVNNKCDFEEFIADL